MTRIKVSGLVRPEDAETVSRLGVDYAACIFYAGSPRYVTIEQAWDVRRALGSRVRLVGIFVDTPSPIVQRVADHCRLDYVQLFGAEPRSAVDASRTHAFKAVTTATRDAAEAAARAFLGRRSGGPADPALLLHVPDGVSEPWSIVPPAARRASTILSAAGLGADNVGEAIRAGSPWAIDVWEAVESQPGHIDAARLEAFVSAVRCADVDAAAGS